MYSVLCIMQKVARGKLILLLQYRELGVKSFTMSVEGSSISDAAVVSQKALYFSLHNRVLQEGIEIGPEERLILAQKCGLPVTAENLTSLDCETQDHYTALLEADPFNARITILSVRGGEYHSNNSPGFRLYDPNEAHGVLMKIINEAESEGILRIGTREPTDVHVLDTQPTYSERRHGGGMDPLTQRVIDYLSRRHKSGVYTGLSQLRVEFPGVSDKTLNHIKNNHRSKWEQSGDDNHTSSSSSPGTADGIDSNTSHESIPPSLHNTSVGPTPPRREEDTELLRNNQAATPGPIRATIQDTARQGLPGGQPRRDRAHTAHLEDDLVVVAIPEPVRRFFDQSYVPNVIEAKEEFPGVPYAVLAQARIEALRKQSFSPHSPSGSNDKSHSDKAHLSRPASEKLVTNIASLSATDIVNLFLIITNRITGVARQEIPFTIAIKTGNIPSNVIYAITKLNPHYHRLSNQTNTKIPVSAHQASSTQDLYIYRRNLVAYVQNMIDEGRQDELLRLPDGSSSEQLESRQVILMWLSDPYKYIKQTS